MYGPSRRNWKIHCSAWEILISIGICFICGKIRLCWLLRHPSLVFTMFFIKFSRRSSCYSAITDLTEHIIKLKSFASSTYLAMCVNCPFNIWRIEAGSHVICVGMEQLCYRSARTHVIRENPFVWCLDDHIRLGTDQPLFPLEHCLISSLVLVESKHQMVSAQGSIWEN